MRPLAVKHALYRLGWLVLGVVLAAGCVPHTPRQPGQDVAEAVVWRGAFAQTRTAPDVSWVPAAELTCFNGHGFILDLTPGGAPTNTCVGGVYWETVDMAEVATPTGGWRLSDSSYTHELYHAYLWHTTGDGDAQHRGPGWQPGGIVEHTNDVLFSLGW